jgi:DNA-binding GntR family transcriptional regulator
MLRGILSDLAKHVRWHFSAVAGIRGEASWTEHEAILSAIAGGEEARAATLAAEHSQHTQNAFFAQLFEDGSVRVS